MARLLFTCSAMDVCVLWFASYLDQGRPLFAESASQRFFHALPNQTYFPEQPMRTNAIMRSHVRTFRSKVNSDLAQGKLHLSGGREAIMAAWSACLDEKFCKIRRKVRANRSRVYHRFEDHRPRIWIRVTAVAKELVEHHAYGKQVGGYVPTGKIGVRWLIWRGA